MTETTEDLVTPEDKMKLLFPHRPWESEPDDAEWVDADTGYKCRIVRRHRTGVLCGYVGVPKGHVLYGEDYRTAYNADNNFDVHGGLTYSGTMGEGDDYYYFGFDTAHGGDLLPGLVVQMLKWAYTVGVVDYHKSDTYRTWGYVMDNVQALALQLKNCDKRSTP